MKDEKVKGYEWIGDAETTIEAPPNKHSEKYYEPNRDYDNKYSPTKDDIKTFPDLQNGPSSLIQGSPVAIQQVGIHNFRLPLKYTKRDGGEIELQTKVENNKGIFIKIKSFLLVNLSIKNPDPNKVMTDNIE